MNGKSTSVAYHLDTCQRFDVSRNIHQVRQIIGRKWEVSKRSCDLGTPIAHFPNLNLLGKFAEVKRWVSFFAAYMANVVTCILREDITLLFYISGVFTCDLRFLSYKSGGKHVCLID